MMCVGAASSRSPPTLERKLTVPVQGSDDDGTMMGSTEVNGSNFLPSESEVGVARYQPPPPPPPPSGRLALTYPTC